jgi:hypothetical protein
MKPGTLVSFTSSVYSHWAVGIILKRHEAKTLDRQEFYDVLTHEGIKMVHKCFMKKL